MYLSDGQLNNSLFHHTVLMKLGFYKEFCPPEPLWRFSPKLQYFAAPHLGFTNSCFYNYIYPPANGFTANDISFWWESFWVEAKWLQAKQILFSYSLISRKLRGQYCSATDMEASSCLLLGWVFPLLHSPGHKQESKATLSNINPVVSILSPCKSALFHRGQVYSLHQSAGTEHPSQNSLWSVICLKFNFYILRENWNRNTHSCLCPCLQGRQLLSSCWQLVRHYEKPLELHI